MYEKEVIVPSKISFISDLPPIQNQYRLGACASFAFTRIASVFDPHILFSPLFSYFFARLLEFGIENIGEDSGVSLRGMLKAANQYGWSLEELWRYIAERFSLEPDDVSKMFATNKLKYKRVVYYKVHTSDEVKYGMTMGYVPFLGITITDSFYSEQTMKTGIIIPPSGKEYGYHAVMSPCFDDDLKKTDSGNGCHVIDNSWGMSVGDNGRFYMPYEVFPTIVNDAWMVKIVDVGAGGTDGIVKTIV